MLRFIKRNYSIVPDFEPHSVTKVISSTKSNAKLQKKHESKAVNERKSEKPAKSEFRSNVNEMGIQMIPQKLFEQIFKNVKPTSVNSNKIDM
jgi:hypothetical protein